MKAILDWPRPQTVHDIRSFLGLASYYRKFIRGFSQIAKPLTDLTREKKTWCWGDAEGNSFTALKVAMATAPVLRLPDFEKQFVVTTDASDVAVGAILEQDFSSGLQPIAFASRKLNATEIRYSAYERELLGIVWAIGQWKHYFQSPHPIVIQTDHAPLRHLPNQTSVNSRVWRWLSVLQGYNVEIRHIPGKRNPADSLSRQLISDALVRKGSVKDANSEYVQKLRVSPEASDAEIQSALHQLFSQGPQGQSVNDSQSQSILSSDQAQCPQGNQSPQGNSESKRSIIAATSISKLQLDDSFRNSIYSLLKNENPYVDIIQELESGRTNIKKGNEVYKMVNKILLIHQTGQDVGIDYWGVVVPNDKTMRDQIIQELHSIPYSAHPGIQRTVGKVRKSFFWRGMSGHIREFVENCPVCQMEKSDHTLSKGKLQSTHIPETKWSEISIDFITDLPTSSRNRDSVLVMVDKATRMVHLSPCSKTINATDTGKLLWNTVVKLHGVPRVIYSDRGSQFIASSWQELWRLTGTKLAFSTAYHPQTQGVVERMNAVVSQTIRCIIHDTGNIKDWEKILPTVELAINSLPNQSTGFSPFFLNYGYEPVTPVQLVKGNEEIKTESIGSFVRRITSIWELARDNLKRSVNLQAKYYDKKHRSVEFDEGEMVLLSSRNLKMKGIPGKLKKRFVGPFKIEQRIGQQAYKLSLPDSWKIHPVFHVSLLKSWHTASLQEDEEPIDDDLELEEPYYEIEKILRWRKVKRGRRVLKEYLVLWKNYPVSEASWIRAEQFSNPDQLQQYLNEDQPLQEQV